MKFKAQSLIEFAIILMSVTAIAIIALQMINARINPSISTEQQLEEGIETTTSTEADNCTKMGLYWDEANGVCEAR